jgi:hypothetical protein
LRTTVACELRDGELHSLNVDPPQRLKDIVPGPDIDISRFVRE